MTKKTPSTLTSELLRVARLGNIQGGLPPILKAAPAVAILAGSVVAKATGSGNLIEERILGPTEGIIVLGEPGRAVGNGSGGGVGGWIGSEGAKRMCAKCVEGKVDSMRGYGFKSRSTDVLWLKGLVMKGKGARRTLLDGETL